MHARAYLRASSVEQDASRARQQVETFAAEHGLNIVGTFLENESGAKLTRPELFRLIADSKPGDVLLIEQVDRLSRLIDSDWRKLRAELEARQIRVVALDLPTSWQLVAPADEFTARMFGAINSMMLGGDGRRKGSPRRSLRVPIAAAPRIPPVTPALLRCSAPVRHGPQFRPRSDAAERRSPRSPSGPLRRRGGPRRPVRIRRRLWQTPSRRWRRLGHALESSRLDLQSRRFFRGESGKVRKVPPRWAKKRARRSWRSPGFRGHYQLKPLHRPPASGR
jgi:hypothetical protein